MTAKSTVVIDVSDQMLPLACPNDHSELWSMHPRVYLPIEQTGEASCPYCGAHYRLAAHRATAAKTAAKTAAQRPTRNTRVDASEDSSAETPPTTPESMAHSGR